MKNHRICYGILCLSALITYIIANSALSLAFLMILLLFAVASFATQKIAMTGLSLDIQTKASCYIDQELMINITIQKKNSILSGPVHIHFVFHNLLYDAKEPKTIILQPCEKQTMHYLYNVLMKDCGNVKISIESVTCMDLFGLFQKTFYFDHEKEVLVYPHQVQLNTLLHRNPETITDGELYDHEKHGQDVNEVSGLRSYVEGDSPRSIHWKLSSKMDDLVVRQFGHPSNYHTLILYQMSKEAEGVKISNELNNALSAICISLSYSLLEKSLEHQVGCMIDGEFYSNPVSSVSDHDQMAINLLCKPMEQSKSTHDMVYQFLRGNLSAEYTKVIYITPEYDELSIRQLARAVDLTIIQVTDSKSPKQIATNGYSITLINRKDYQGKIHNISI